MLENIINKADRKFENIMNLYQVINSRIKKFQARITTANYEGVPTMESVQDLKVGRKTLIESLTSKVGRLKIVMCCPPHQ